MKELENLANNLKQNISNAVAGYIADNRDNLKGDRGAGITSITAAGDKVTVNYDDSQTTTFTVPTIPGTDGKNAKEIKVRKVFSGELNSNVKINLGENWLICALTIKYTYGPGYEITFFKTGTKLEKNHSDGNSTKKYIIDNNQFWYINNSTNEKVIEISVLEVI